MSDLQRKWLQWGLAFVAIVAALGFVVLIPFAAFHIFFSSEFNAIPLSILIGLIASLAVSLIACAFLTLLQPNENRE